MLFGIMDRYLLRRFVRAYLVAFVSLVGLYAVIDCFDKLDEFTEHSAGHWKMLEHIAKYYMYRSALFFDRLSGVIALMGVMFVITWLRRNNELTPLIAAGVSTHRAISPLIFAAVAMNVPVLVNQELIIPRIAYKLMRAADDPAGGKIVNVDGCYDGNGILITGTMALRKQNTIQSFHVTLPRRIAGQLVTIRSPVAVYSPPKAPGENGTWSLHNARPPRIDIEHPAIHLGDEPGAYTIESDVTLDQLSRSKRWYEFVSTAQLVEELQNPRAIRRSEMEVLLHTRLTRPFLNITLLFLGLPVVLSGENRKMVWNIGISLAVSASLHAMTFISQSLGHHEQLPAALAAWLPLLLFGSAAVAINDLITT
jgi:lipopolysaccharide export system permease protein